MGLVYLAEDRQGRQIAIKTIRPELATDDAFLKRFKREAEAASKVEGRYTARVLRADPERTRRIWLSSSFPARPWMGTSLSTDRLEVTSS